MTSLNIEINRNPFPWNVEPLWEATGSSMYLTKKTFPTSSPENMKDSQEIQKRVTVGTLLFKGSTVKEPVDVHYFCLYLILLVLICSLKSKTGLAMRTASNSNKLTLVLQFKLCSRVHRNFAATITGITRKTLWGVCKRTSGCYLWGYAKVTVLFIHELFVCSKIQSLRGEEDYCHYNVDYHLHLQPTKHCSLNIPISPFLKKCVLRYLCGFRDIATPKIVLLAESSLDSRTRAFWDLWNSLGYPIWGSNRLHLDCKFCKSD